MMNIFHNTEFKLTHHLERKYHFPSLKIIPVTELVHYGLDGKSSNTTIIPSPSMLEQYAGTHLEPTEYHQKLSEPNTVVIDVRNHYEAMIGHFQPPSSSLSPSSSTSSNDQNDFNTTVTNSATTTATSSSSSSTFLDPKMRKSTEFPLWLDNPTTKEQLRGKQVLMYCTGGIRCERASALLQYKIQNDPSVQALNIKGVYQLQGGVDKYFKQFPDGGYWVGKNYTFDKRCAHTPVETSSTVPTPAFAQPSSNEDVDDDESARVPLGKCAACTKPWDKYGGKPCRCPTCGVPNLICKDCFTTNKKRSKNMKCDLCVEQNISFKQELRDREQQQEEMILHEHQNRSFVTRPKKGFEATTPLSASKSSSLISENPNGITRLYLRNMCRTSITVEKLLDILPEITHIVWKMDGKSGTFFGQGWVEMKSVEAAALAVSQSGALIVCGRQLYIEYQAPDGKDRWPPPRSAVTKK
jgi:predicted sulfurtransferase